jgi:hypothetical protein
VGFAPDDPVFVRRLPHHEAHRHHQVIRVWS